MENQILNKIKQYDSIIIYRHKNPDLDAIGSQMGLYYTLKDNFPNKNIYVLGDLNEYSNLYNIEMNESLSNEIIYKNSLAIILDVAVSHLVSSDTYNLCNEVIIIDHHQNETNITPSLFYQRSDLPAAALTLAYLFKQWNFNIPKLAATYLYAGLSGDTGRFMYINNQNAVEAFKLTSYITQFNPDIKYVYDHMYTEALADKQVKNMFTHFKLTKNNVAYQINDYEKVLKAKLSPHVIARKMIGQMAGIKEVPIWASFTEDKETNSIKAEVRSRDITVVDVCKDFGGGGHNLACGATLNNWDEVNLMIEQLNKKVEK